VPARSLANWQNPGLTEAHITSSPTATVSFRMLYHPVLHHFILFLFKQIIMKYSRISILGLASSASAYLATTTASSSLPLPSVTFVMY
jgi:hypothetical protein